MIIDQLILNLTTEELIAGVAEGDTLVLNYLDTLNYAELEAKFAPMFAVTRPAPKSDPKESREPRQQQRAPRQQASAVKVRDERIKNLSAEKLALLEGLL